MLKLPQTEERERKLLFIENYLKENPEVDIKSLILEICSQMGCSDRKAKEYLKIAKWRILKNVLDDNGIQRS